MSKYKITGIIYIGMTEWKIACSERERVRARECACLRVCLLACVRDCARQVLIINIIWQNRQLLQHFYSAVLSHTHNSVMAVQEIFTVDTRMSWHVARIEERARDSCFHLQFQFNHAWVILDFFFFFFFSRPVNRKGCLVTKPSSQNHLSESEWLFTRKSCRFVR